MTPSTGLFLVVEGVDGSGKSTLVARVAERLRRAGVAVTTTREPGGTRIAEQIRAIVKGVEDDASGPPDAESVLLLMEAARSENLTKVVGPALARGHVVISDRYTPSTRVYQGGCLGRPGAVAELHALLRRPTPAVTFLVDVPTEVALRRLSGDRSERTGASTTGRLTFQRSAYLGLAETEPGRWVVLDGTSDADDLADAVVATILGTAGAEGRGDSPAGA